MLWATAFYRTISLSYLLAYYAIMALSLSSGGIPMQDVPTSSAEIVLYDGSLGGTPDTQGKLRYRASPGSATTQSFADGTTVLDSTAQKRDAAGYFADSALGLTLDRAAGYVLNFAVQVIDEDHDGSD